MTAHAKRCLPRRVKDAFMSHFPEQPPALEAALSWSPYFEDQLVPDGFRRLRPDISIRGRC